MKFVITQELQSGKFYVSDEKIHGFILHVKDINDALIFDRYENAILFMHQENMNKKYYKIERID